MGVAQQYATLWDERESVRYGECPCQSETPTFRDFAAVPSNVVAFEAARLFAEGVQPFVAIFGPSGWGKTHLLQAACARLGERSGSVVSPENALDWMAGYRHSGRDVLVLDDVQDAIDKPRVRSALRILIERRVRGRRPTFLAFTSEKPTRTAKSSLPLAHEWTCATLKAPTSGERTLIVAQAASTHGLQIADSLRDILAKHLAGNGRTLVGALNRLFMLSPTWLDSHAVLRACGVLNPFFACNANWDLREHLYEVANVLSSEELAGFQASELAVHAMLRVALLGETDVARFFKAEPAHVYGLAAKTESRIRRSELSSEAARKFVERAVAKLQLG